jgi:hypothetical protein
MFITSTSIRGHGLMESCESIALLVTDQLVRLVNLDLVYNAVRDFHTELMVQMSRFNFEDDIFEFS